MALRGRLAALPGWNEGSLLRRTLLHVTTMVLGSVAFLAVTSLILVSITKGILPDHGTSDDDEAPAASGSPTSKPALPKGIKRRPGSPAEPPPSADDKEE
jgi:hypothetical protein